MESGFNFGLGFFGASIASQIGLAIFVILAGVIAFIIGYIYYWYKQKTRKCPKCESKEYRYFTETTCLSDRRIEKCQCYKCNHIWSI